MLFPANNGWQHGQSRFSRSLFSCCTAQCEQATNFSKGRSLCILAWSYTCVNIQTMSDAHSAIQSQAYKVARLLQGWQGRANHSSAVSYFCFESAGSVHEASAQSPRSRMPSGPRSVNGSFTGHRPTLSNGSNPQIVPAYSPRAHAYASSANGSFTSRRRSSLDGRPPSATKLVSH